MKIALIGYGNMGREIERLIQEKNKHTIVSISYKLHSDLLDIEGIKKADVAIDFTSPQIVEENIKKVAALGVHMVIGTTGWYERLPSVERMIKKAKTGLMYGQNFSIGANIFFAIVGFSSRMFSRFGNYDVYGLEVHHSGKKDSPSGTARKLADVVMKNFPQKKSLQDNKVDRQIKPHELHFASVRGGNNPGLHEIVFDSFSDEIKLIHQARGRRGFAEGAILAAEFIKNKKGLYNFSDIFQKKGSKVA